MKAGWELKTLGEVATLQRGFDLPKKERTPGQYPLVTSSGATDTHNEAKVTGPGVVTGRSGSIGKVFYINEDFWPLNTALYIKNFHNNDDRFIWYLLQALDLSRFSSGTGVPTLNRNHVHGVSVFIPIELEEQKRIVSILDEAFEGLDRARENAEANLKSARELFEEALDKMLLVQSTSWSETTLGETYDVRDGTHDSPKYVEIGHPLVTSKNLGPNGLHFNKVKFINENDFTAISKRSEVNTGDVLFAMIGTIGNPVVVEVKPDFAIKNVALFKMINGRSGYFLRYFLSSKRTMTKMMSEAKGTTQQFVGLGYLRGFPIKVPPLEIEDAFVAQVRDIDEKARAIRVHYTSKLQDISDLRQSLLQKAFAGELT